MASGATYRVRTKQLVQITSPQEDTPPAYPSKWFESHKGKKPLLVVKYKTSPLDNLRGVVKAGIKGQKLDVQVAVAFLYGVFKDVTGVLADDWNSFGVEIGKAGEAVNPFRLLDVDTKEEDPPNAGTITATKGEDMWLCFFLLSQYRLQKVTNAEYEKILIKKANLHLNAMPEQNEHTSISTKGGFAAYLMNPNYLRVVAALDMFFHKFKEHEFAIMRFGTLGSRYKDCSALTSLNHIKKLTGLSMEDFMLWIFTDSIADDLEQLAQPGQELDKHDSYAPYMRDMGVSDKSPYSAQANPSIHLFCHAIGTLLHSRRSINARMGPEVDTMSTIKNAQVVAYVLSTCPTFAKGFTKSLDTIPGLASKEVMGELPGEPDPDRWFDYLSEQGFKIPLPIEQHSHDAARSLTNLRPDTVGQHLAGLLGV
ncbi:MAG: nucleoprotein [Longquan Niviventer coninga ledantevirus 1]|uniref:Nucleoprotein n=1 Tax=Longquan Niviventer coninga ledantevirus 1 TaxID=2877507 RepID=A0A9E8YX95_9RHAB|nr:MAG: nucleoprotein [Longquan Niviventer coninga ledantevirus 1]WAK77077.1 MAG: nucleoprotein [Longquan Niviventer coninga ledantevirus 1]